MDEVLRHRGRVVTQADVQFIRDLIEREPGASRRELSKKLCEAWDWRQPNGALRDMVCRGLMLSLHRVLSASVRDRVGSVWIGSWASHRRAAHGQEEEKEAGGAGSRRAA